ncbi:MAG TPA: hypothetical protein VHA82_07670 [Ramlibacter sp.]|uniref:hypothetical protein n=1 Tax=Ramlibacter sp. TaxID=1917967 RepID=UPI002C746108|nr:hypothetical protein [Ramlibacter sp.]HVZ43674.1 hypothetical protein [Ramlibacter sp.]
MAGEVMLLAYASPHASFFDFVARPELKQQVSGTGDTPRLQDPLLQSLLKLFGTVASVSGSMKVPLDPERAASQLRERVQGGEIDLRGMSPELADLLRAFSADDWRDLQKVLEEAGQNVTHLKVDADSLAIVRPALFQRTFAKLHCVTVMRDPLYPFLDHAEKRGLQDDEGMPRVRFVRPGVVEVLRRVAEREDPSRPAFDVESVAADLDARISGLKLNLCAPSDELQQCLRSLTEDDVKALVQAVASSGGIGIAHVHVDSQGLLLFEDVLNEECFAQLQHVIVHGHGGTTVMAPREVRGAKAGDAPGASAPARVVPATPQAEACPCTGDPVLRERLVEILTVIAKEPDFAESEMDVGVVAQAIMDCASLDGSGDFGWDFRQVPPEHLPWVQALGVAAFVALQDSAERAGTGTAWLALPEGLEIDAYLVTCLKQLSPLCRLSVAAPARSLFVDLGALQGPGVYLGEVVIREAKDRALWITVPAIVTTVRAEESADAETPSRWKVTRQGATGQDLDAAYVHRPVGGEALLDTLTDVFSGMDALSDHDPSTIAHAFLECAEFDAQGRFGWDFRRLDPEFVPWLQFLPQEAFMALQDCSLDAGEGGTAWLALPDGVDLDDDFVAGLACFSPLTALSVAAPDEGIYMNLRGLRGNALQLETLAIRFRNEALRLDLPDSVKEVRAEGEGQDALLRATRITYWNAAGKRVAAPLAAPAMGTPVLRPLEGVPGRQRNEQPAAAA